MPSSASTQLNSTQLNFNSKAEVSFILKQIQPATHPPDRTSRERRLKCQFQFQLKQRLRLSLLSNKFFYPPTNPPRQSPSHPSRSELKGDLSESFHGLQEQQQIQELPKPQIHLHNFWRWLILTLNLFKNFKDYCIFRVFNVLKFLWSIKYLIFLEPVMFSVFK